MPTFANLFDHLNKGRTMKAMTTTNATVKTTDHTESILELLKAKLMVLTTNDMLHDHMSLTSDACVAIRPTSEFKIRRSARSEVMTGKVETELTTMMKGMDCFKVASKLPKLLSMEKVRKPKAYGKRKHMDPMKAALFPVLVIMSVLICMPRVKRWIMNPTSANVIRTTMLPGGNTLAKYALLRPKTAGPIIMPAWLHRRELLEIRRSLILSIMDEAGVSTYNVKIRSTHVAEDYVQ